ncbi:hypothetical protein ACJX0J_015058 [Zea mays]
MHGVQNLVVVCALQFLISVSLVSREYLGTLVSIITRLYFYYTLGLNVCFILPTGLSSIGPAHELFMDTIFHSDCFAIISLQFSILFHVFNDKDVFIETTFGYLSHNLHLTNQTSHIGNGGTQLSVGIVFYWYNTMIDNIMDAFIIQNYKGPFKEAYMVPQERLFRLVEKVVSQIMKDLLWDIDYVILSAYNTRIEIFSYLYLLSLHIILIDCNPEYMGFWQQITLISMGASAGTERQGTSLCLYAYHDNQMH